LPDPVWKKITVSMLYSVSKLTPVVKLNLLCKSKDAIRLVKLCQDRRFAIIEHTCDKSSLSKQPNKQRFSDVIYTWRHRISKSTDCHVYSPIKRKRICAYSPMYLPVSARQFCFCIKSLLPPGSKQVNFTDNCN
jgi:hypothetical protein